MYASNMYLGEKNFMSIFHPDTVMVDWRARLFGRLQDLGFEVVNKMHPESPFQSPPAFARELGASEMYTPLEQVITQSDLLLLDYTRASALGLGLKAGKPIVIIDFGLEQWVDEAYQALLKRCAVVTGRIDSGNRLHVDWDELAAAIRTAVTLDDGGAFFRTYIAYP